MTDRHSDQDMGWAIPVMQAGYAGRGLVYVIVAGISLYSIYRGGEAQGTSSALGWLERTPFGAVLLVLVALGMLAYAVWRVVDAAWDLEDYGADGEGIVARLGMLVTGAVHLGIGAVAATLLFTAGSGGSGEGSSIPKYVGMVMSLPMGRYIIGAVALIVIGAGGYYLHKGWTEKYREHLRGTSFTTRWNTLLKIGVMAQGMVIGVVGLLLFYAALRADPEAAGGVGAAFEWLSSQAYGRVLVILLCLGLLAFAVFCFVNARNRIVPKASGPDVETLAARLHT